MRPFHINPNAAVACAGGTENASVAIALQLATWAWSVDVFHGFVVPVLVSVGLVRGGVCGRLVAET